MATTEKKKKGNPTSLNVIIYYMIENTELQDITDKGWRAYKDALALTEKEFTMAEGEKTFRNLLRTGWSVADGLTLHNWKKFVPEDFLK